MGCDMALNKAQRDKLVADILAQWVTSPAKALKLLAKTAKLKTKKRVVS
jgi:hypothetical protein